MVNRAGTPAVDDPPAPAWLKRIWGQPGLRFEATLSVPAEPASSLLKTLHPVRLAAPDDEMGQAA
jgi:hypothetical protein